MAKSETGRHRSPAYPSIDLESAIERIQQIYRHESRNFAHVDVILSHWEYSPGSANGLRAVAALKQYGLVEDQGKKENRRIKLTERAIDVLLPEEEGSEQHKQAAWDAALEPVIHQEIWKKYDGQLPSDAALKRYLLLERDFNDTTVDGFIRQFRRTLAYTESASEDTIQGKNGGNNGPKKHPRVGDYVQRNFPESARFTQPLKVTGTSDDGEWAFVEGIEKGVAMSALDITGPPQPAITLPTPPGNPNFAPPEEDQDDSPSEGSARERTTLDEGPVVLTMPDKLSSESVVEFEYWANGIIQRMRRKTGAHKSRILDTGEEVHLVKHPSGDKWYIKSYDWSWTTDGGRLLENARVFSQNLGWENLEFESSDKAFSFVQEKINSGEVPRKAK